jgi:hypothetical protein
MDASKLLDAVDAYLDHIQQTERTDFRGKCVECEHLLLAMWNARDNLMEEN